MFVRGKRNENHPTDKEILNNFVKKYNIVEYNILLIAIVNIIM